MAAVTPDWNLLALTSNGCLVHKGRRCVPGLRILSEDYSALIGLQQGQEVLLDTASLFSAVGWVIGQDAEQ